MCGDRSLRVALLLEPGTDSLKRSVSTAPAIVVNVVLHVVVVTVDASNQGHLEKTNVYVLSKTACQSFKREIRDDTYVLYIRLYVQSNVPLLGPERDV